MRQFSEITKTLRLHCATPRRGRGISAIRSRGLSISEVLISLAITSTLLTAVATAFQASAQAIENNDEFFRATQAARVSLLHILSEVRRGTVDQPASSTELRLITAETSSGGGEEDRTYKWNSTTKKLLLITNDVTTDPDYTLASNVSAVSFLAEMGTDYNNTACVARLAVTIAVKVGDNEIRLSGSAAPRRNLTY